MDLLLLIPLFVLIAVAILCHRLAFRAAWGWLATLGGSAGLASVLLYALAEATPGWDALAYILPLVGLALPTLAGTGLGALTGAVMRRTAA